MPSESTWRIVPIKLAIMQSLQKYNGIILEEELLENLEKLLGLRPSPQELNRELLTLEINGLIHVSQIKKNQKRISMVKKEQQFLAIGED